MAANPRFAASAIGGMCERGDFPRENCPEIGVQTAIGRARQKNNGGEPPVRRQRDRGNVCKGGFPQGELSRARRSDGDWPSAPKKQWRRTPGLPPARSGKCVKGGILPFHKTVTTNRNSPKCASGARGSFDARARSGESGPPTPASPLRGLRAALAALRKTGAKRRAVRERGLNASCLHNPKPLETVPPLPSRLVGGRRRLADRAKNNGGEPPVRRPPDRGESVKGGIPPFHNQ